MIGHVLKRNWVTPRIQLTAARATCEISCSLIPKAPNIKQSVFAIYHNGKRVLDKSF